MEPWLVEFPITGLFHIFWMNYNDLTATSLAKKITATRRKKVKLLHLETAGPQGYKVMPKKIDHHRYLWQNYEQTSAQL